MTLYNPVFALTGFVVAYLCTSAISRIIPPPSFGKQRSYSIDGLRGYLAFGVLLHHGFIWHVYLRTGHWITPSSRIYAHLGNGCVVTFFMITAFLFGGKLLNERGTHVAWRKLYIGRFFRLMPTYLLMLALMIALVFIATGPVVHGTPLELFTKLVRWGALAVFGMPPINNFAGTARVIAGVPWTLRFEVLFYAALPALALLMGCKAAWPWIMFGTACLALISAFAFFSDGMPSRALPCSFLVGLISAYLSRNKMIMQIAQRPAVGLVVILFILLGGLVSEDGMRVSTVAFYGMAFILIAAGNNLFGLLRTRASRLLGEISFGIYLFHGIVLYVVFTYVIGEEAARQLSVLEHWIVVLCCVPVVLLGATIAHVFIEKPGIALGKLIANAKRWPAQRPSFVWRSSTN